MSTRIKMYGSKSLTIPASDKLTIYSQDIVRVYKRNNAGGLDLFATVPADTEYLSAAFSAAAFYKIEASGADALFQNGVAPAITERRALRGQGTPGVLNATGALTAAMILSGIVTTTVAAAVTATLPTGTVMDAAFEMEIGESFDWSVVSITGGNAFTVTAATGHTVVGTMAVATVTSAVFRTRKTAAVTYVTYRIG